MAKFTALAILTLLLALGGCAGGGGGGGGTSGCGPDYQTPNYASDTDPGTGRANILIHWSAFPLRVFYAGDVVYDPSGANISFAGLMRESINRWTTASSSGARITEVGSADSADVTVTYVRLDAPPASGSPLAFTTLYYSESTKVMAKAEITIYYWDSMTREQVENGVRTTSGHEFGHALFINGHSADTSDLMYYRGSLTTDKPVTTKDANTLATTYCGVYPSRSPDRVMPDDLVKKTIYCR